MEKTLVGLTGNYCSGKSTVRKIFEKYGIKCIDADKIVHELYETDEDLKYTLISKFKEKDILDSNGEIDRSKLKNIISDKDKKKDLESIVWPRVREEINQRTKDSSGITIVEATLLFESGWYNNFDKNIYVKCDYETQLERGLKRDDKKYTEEQIKGTIDSQLHPISPEEKEELADYVIENNRDEASLQKEVWEIYQDIESNDCSIISCLS